jgi:N-terminal half of MaoC dehydratase
MNEYITDEVKALIGVWSPLRTAVHPIEKGIVRRFYQAVGDVNPLYWDEELAAKSKYGGVIAPALFTPFAFDQPDGVPDPIEGKGADPDYQGYGRPDTRGEGEPPTLPPVPIPLGRGLNAGPEQEFYGYPQIGDVISAKSRYYDIYQQRGSSGLMIFTVTETVYTNQRGEVLLVSKGRSVRYPVKTDDKEA